MINTFRELIQGGIAYLVYPSGKITPVTCAQYCAMLDSDLSGTYIHLDLDSAIARQNEVIERLGRQAIEDAATARAESQREAESTDRRHLK